MQLESTCALFPHLFDWFGGASSLLSLWRSCSVPRPWSSSGVLSCCHSTRLSSGDPPSSSTTFDFQACIARLLVDGLRYSLSESFRFLSFGSWGQPLFGQACLTIGQFAYLLLQLLGQVHLALPSRDYCFFRWCRPTYFSHVCLHRQEFAFLALLGAPAQDDRFQTQGPKLEPLDPEFAGAAVR